MRNMAKCGWGLGIKEGLRNVYISNLNPLLSLEPFKKFIVVGGLE